MENLQIYDSQGRPLGQERGAVNQRIKDFFFGGVRAALTKTGSTFEFICFFRARDSSASRSEQYYGLLETRDSSDLSNFRNIIEDHLEREYDKALDTASEDTTVFDALGNVGLKSTPGEKATRDNVVDLVTSGERAQLGVGSYEEATVLFQDLISNFNSPSLAIAENAKNSQLSEYDIVIEKGPYSGLELLGGTADRIEEMKERRRKQRQQELGVGPYGQQPQSRVERLLPVVGAAFGVVVAIVLVLYGACFLGVSIPIIGGPPGVSCGDTVDGPANATYNVTDITAEWQGNELTVNGTLEESRNGSSEKNENVSVALANKSGGHLADRNKTVNLAEKTFGMTLSFDEATKKNASVVTVELPDGVTGNATLEPPDEGSTTDTKGADTMDEVTAEWQDTNLTLSGMLVDDGTAWTKSAELTVKLRNDTTRLTSTESTVKPDANGTFKEKLPYNSTLKQDVTEVRVEWRENVTGNATVEPPDEGATTDANITDGITNASAEWLDTDLSIEGFLANNGTALDGKTEITITLQNETKVNLKTLNRTVMVEEGEFDHRVTYDTTIKQNASYAVLEWEVNGTVYEEEVKLTSESGSSAKLTPPDTQIPTTTSRSREATTAK